MSLHGFLNGEWRSASPKPRLPSSKAQVIRSKSIKFEIQRNSSCSRTSTQVLGLILDFFLSFAVHLAFESHCLKRINVLKSLKGDSNYLIIRASKSKSIRSTILLPRQHLFILSILSDYIRAAVQATVIWPMHTSAEAICQVKSCNSAVT